MDRSAKLLNLGNFSNSVSAMICYYVHGVDKRLSRRFGVLGSAAVFHASIALRQGQFENAVPMGNRPEAFGKKIDKGSNLRRRTAIRRIHGKNAIQRRRSMIQPERDEQPLRDFPRDQECRLADDALSGDGGGDKRIAIIGLQASTHSYADFFLIAELPAPRAAPRERIAKAVVVCEVCDRPRRAFFLEIGRRGADNGAARG